MAVTYQTVNSIGAGIQHSFAADGDAYHVLNGVVVASNNSDTIQSTVANTDTTILGTVLSESSAIELTSHQGGHTVFIGETGVVTSNYDENSDIGGLFSNGDYNIWTNHGEVSVQHAMGMRLGGNNTEVLNTGKIDANTGISFEDGAYAKLTNTGTIAANGLYADVGYYYTNVGVRMASNNGQIFNGKTGVITAVAADAAAVLFEAQAGANEPSAETLLINNGEITSLNGAAIDTFYMEADDTVAVRNYGYIAGQDASYYGGDGVDNVYNAGAMESKVDLGAGDDSYRGRDDGYVRGVIYGRDGADKLFGSGNVDQMYGGAQNDDIKGRGGEDFLKGEDGNDEVRGGAGDDRVEGGAGADDLYGGAGEDDMKGGAGADAMHGGSGDDHMLGGGGNDWMGGGSGSDYLSGGDGADYMTGGADDDDLYGGAGADTLNGGSGDDMLTGGGGKDVFVFNEPAGHDFVTDFQDGSDKIDLAAFNTTYGDLVASGAMSDAERGAVIDLGALGGSGSVTIDDIYTADLSNADFVF